MRRLSIIIGLVASMQVCHAQTLAEWFKQKSTYKKYSITNIANNEVYYQLLKQSYGVYKDGTNLWHGLKDGEFKMHTAYFDSRKAVSPTVARYQKLQTCAKLQEAILLEYKRGQKDFSGAKYLSVKEKDYIKKVYSNLLDKCSKSMDELNMVATSNKLEMSDDERIKNIDRIYDGFRDKFAFVQSFNNDTRILNLQRQRESGQTATLQSLYGTK